MSSILLCRHFQTTTTGFNQSWKTRALRKPSRPECGSAICRASHSCGRWMAIKRNRRRESAFSRRSTVDEVADGVCHLGGTCQGLCRGDLDHRRNPDAFFEPLRAALSMPWPEPNASVLLQAGDSLTGESDAGNLPVRLGRREGQQRPSLC